jgi:hypothetical protein
MDSENLTAKRRRRLPALTVGVGGALLFLWFVRAAGQSHFQPYSCEQQVAPLSVVRRGPCRNSSHEFASTGGDLQ